MLRFFRHIRKQLTEQNKVRAYFLYAIGEILLNLLTKTCPGRDYLSVELMDGPNDHRAVRYGMCQNNDVATNHMAYLRHAVLRAVSVFYQYVVPTGQPIWVKPLNHQNPNLRQGFDLQALFPC